MNSKVRITVQVISLVDGEVREVVANVPAATEQAAVDMLFALAKDEKAYRYMGESGIINPSHPPIPAFTTKYAPGEWFAIS